MIPEVRTHNHPVIPAVLPESIVTRLGEILCLLIFPIAWFLTLHLSAVNQAGYLDPYFYTGYIHNMADLFARYGLPYYSVRFGLILPARLLGLAFGFDAGYLIFRYLLALIAGIPVYLFARGLFGRVVGLAIYSALLTTPFFTRSLFWDHPDAAAVPYLLGAIGLFLLGRHPVRDVAAGILFGLALHCNFFTVSVSGLFFAAFSLATILLRRPLGPLVIRIGCVFAGVMLATFAGVIYYWRLIGVLNILSPTLEVSRWLSRGGMLDYRLPGVSWIRSNLHVLVLPIIAIYTLFASCFRRVRLEVLTLTLYVVATSLYFYIYQLFFRADILQLHYYYVYSLPAIFFSVIVVIDQLWHGLEDFHSALLSVILFISFLGPWVIGVYVWNWFPAVHLTQFVELAIVAGAAVAAAILIRGDGGWRRGFASIATFSLGLFLAAGFSGPIFAGVFERKGSQERNIYRVAEQFISAVPKQRDHPGRVCFWYSNRSGDMINSVQATYLWGFSRCSSPIAGAGMPVIGEFESKQFEDPKLKYIVLLGDSADELTSALAALKASNIAFVPVQNRILSSGDYRIYFEYVELVRR
jgi:hypothetical protein